MKWLVAALLLVHVHVVSAQTPQEVAQTGFAATVTVLTFDQHGQQLGLGSGFAVGPGLIVTNAHVIAGAHSASVRPIGDSSAGRVEAILALDERLDLALLQAPVEAEGTLTVNSLMAPVVGDPIYAVGSPLGLEGTFSQGIVSGYRTVGDVQLIQITAPISPGSSGGPVLDSSGNLVGVAVGTFEAGQNLNFAIPVTSVERFLAAPRQPISVEFASPPSNTGSDAPSAVGEAALEGRNLLFEFSGRYSFSLRNSINRSVTNIVVLVVFYDQEGIPLETDMIRVSSTIQAGLASRVSSRVHASVQTIVTGRSTGTDPRTRIEYRVLGFEFAD